MKIPEYRQELNIRLKIILLQFGFSIGYGINGAYLHLIPSLIVQFPYWKYYKGWGRRWYIATELSFLCIQFRFAIFFGRKAADNKFRISKSFRYK